jgi:hypothetical protein
MLAVSESGYPQQHCVKVAESFELSDDQAMMKRKQIETGYDRRLINDLGFPRPTSRNEKKNEGIVDYSPGRCAELSSSHLRTWK